MCCSLITFALWCRWTQTKSVSVRRFPSGVPVFVEIVFLCRPVIKYFRFLLLWFCTFYSRTRTKAPLSFAPLWKGVARALISTFDVEPNRIQSKGSCSTFLPFYRFSERAFIKPCRRGVVLGEREKNRLEINEEDDEGWWNITMSSSLERLMTDIMI